MTTVKPIVEERQHHSWGLLVQGRPATPSEGRAQVSNLEVRIQTQTLTDYSNILGLDVRIHNPLLPITMELAWNSVLGT
ncbi:hypothetical protein OCU04_003949 [Sclerotinia nivalis]|uniref:Uncharacterized protein n=1 Tax=Sclerotinia nivalis TaxID=352851 RepID=A0A9X0DMA1_9HELO|nr:hypothetical protein OCU04_003949 [Sclerotinia nivalis]